MKNSRKMFILTELVLAVTIMILAFVMLREKGGKELPKVSVIIQNSDDDQWAAFKYGLRMAAEDQNVEMLVVSTEGALDVEEQQRLIEGEIENGADAVIVQPAAGEGSEEMLKRMKIRVPVMAVECAPSDEKGESVLPSTKPDHYAMGMSLARELLEDYNGNIEEKTLGILSETHDAEAAASRRKGFLDGLRGTGAKISWSVSGSSKENEEALLRDRTQVDFVISLDDWSLRMAGKYSRANQLHGALVYGVGNSTEAIYYLDTGMVECLVVPDEFNVGYESMTEVSRSLEHFFHRMEDKTVSHTVIRRDTLFSKENQEILLTMNR